MSGIVTIFGYRPSAPEVNPAELLAIRESMRSRGPDDAGEWHSPDRRIGLGHRRLAILDLTAAGHQPMISGRYIVNFDGKIYNYPELRVMLEREGVVFESSCDTEILPHLFARRGLDMLQLLRGMFAFTLIDLHTRRLLAARDPYGIKPLYISNDGQTLRIASQVSALVAGGHVSKEVDPAAAAGFFLTGSVPEPLTIRTEVRALPAGHFIWVDETGPSQPKRYFSIAEEYAHAHAANVQTFEQDETAQFLRHSLRDSVRRHLISDVPVGAFLSSDADSAALASLAGEVSRAPVRSITVAFSDDAGSHGFEPLLPESPAHPRRIEHSTRVVTRGEFVAELPRFFGSMDQPTIGGATGYFVSKAASEIGLKVALSAVGADELLGGSAPFRRIPPLVAATWMPSRIPKIPRAFRNAIDSLSAKPKLAGLLEFGGSYAGAYFLQRSLFMPWELDTLLGREMAEHALGRLDVPSMFASCLIPDPGTAHARVATLEASLHLRNQRLRDLDWASTAHSVEVRLPLVDSTVLRDLAPFALATRSGLRHMFVSADHEPKSGLTLPLEEWALAGIHSSESWQRRWARVVWNEFSAR